MDFIDKIHLTRKYDRNIFTLTLRDNCLLKTEFTYYPLKNIELENIIDGLQMDSFNDIVVNKLCALADRFDIKDYLDIYCSVNEDADYLKTLIDAAEENAKLLAFVISLNQDFYCFLKDLKPFF